MTDNNASRRSSWAAMDSSLLKNGSVQKNANPPNLLPTAEEEEEPGRRRSSWGEIDAMLAGLDIDDAPSPTNRKSDVDNNSESTDNNNDNDSLSGGKPKRKRKSRSPRARRRPSKSDLLKRISDSRLGPDEEDD